MKIVKQHTILSVKNHDISETKLQPSRHGELFPNTVRAIIAGPSGSGKTNILLSLIFDKNGLKFENVYVYSKSLFQQKYQLLQTVLKSIKGIGYFPYDEDAKIVDPFNARPNSIFVFDDVACDKQNIIRCYFCMGRHRNIDCFYLCQTYTRIPKHLIRDNANFLILLQQDEMNLRHVHRDHVGTDMTFDKFFKICQECWKDKFGFLVISKENNLNSGRYRKGFDSFIKI